MLIVLVLTALSVRRPAAVEAAGPIDRDLTTAQAEAFGTATGGIASIESLKANGAEETLFARWAATTAARCSWTSGGSSAPPGAVPNLSILLITAAVIGIGGAQVIGGAMSLGDLVGFQSLLLPFPLASTRCSSRWGC